MLGATHLRSWLWIGLDFMFLLLAATAYAGAVSSNTVPPTNDILVDAQLDYGTFRGAYSSEYNITYWKTVPFAAPPVGVNRFRGPQPLVVNSTRSTTVVNASRPFPMCPQREASGDEDCLYLGLYGRPWTMGHRLRPVVVVFYGGGFIRGSAELSMPPSAYPVLNVTSVDNDLLFVYPNYRTNVFGFLAGREVGEDPHSDTNAGLLDQKAALKWVQRYIHRFGGDTDDVTIWGQSAGGGSVVAQVASMLGANNNTFEKPLFHRAMASSPYWPKTYRYDAPESRKIYDDLVKRVGCQNSSDSLACLKEVDVQTLRDASSAMTVDRDATATSSYVWAPVLDDSFLRKPLSSLKRDGRLMATFATYNTHEGENFVPTWLFPKRAKNATTDDDKKQFHTWLVRYLPDLTMDDVAEVDRLYPETGDVDGGDEKAYQAYTSGNPFGRAGLVYRDVTLACPAYWMTGLSSNDSVGWLAEYSISPAKHASDTYWWNTVNKAQTTDPIHYKGYAGALASFFATGDPNQHKLTSPTIPELPDRTSGREWTITAGGFSTRSLAQLQKRCDSWKSIAPRISV
ncbi:hypothetical protein Sste5346_009730 [Sporothrix stenoceras]|uniref:Carboxylic ester hydrolase n=1 Tax=Sporothrix stenoceras TaxID=5173 RepID=A0ABR3YJY1_9PEZI